MFDGRDLGNAERMVDDWQDGIEARAAGARELSIRLAALTASARSADGLVEVKVGATGDLVGLELAEGIRERPAAETARGILATLRAARISLIEAVKAVAAETVGTDSATGRAVIASYRGRVREPDE
jgi:hypothetical protein